MRMRHIVMWPVRLCNIFLHYLINGAISGGKNIEHKMCVLAFSVQFLYATFLILRRIERGMIIKCVLVFAQSTRYSCQILMKLEFCRHIFEKYSNVKFHENPSILTDGRTDVTKLIVAFRNFAKAPETNTM
jgi:hypothetical protein